MRTLATMVFGVAVVAAAALAGCTDSNAPVGAPHALGGSFFDKSSPDYHGSPSLLRRLPCSGCHDTAEKCFQCHFGSDPTTLYVPPGVTDWSHGTFPHDAPELTARRDVCDRCHSITQSVRKAPPTCHACHEPAPPVTHSLQPQWMLDHGPAYLAGTQNCAACHNLDTKCSQCHFGTSGSRAPLGSPWVHGTTPHLFRESEAVCNNCHARMRGLEQGPAPCHDCHAPHPTGQAFLDKKAPTFHGGVAAQDLSSCTPCHGSDYRGGTSGVSCFTCHFTPGGSRAPAGSSWTHGLDDHEAMPAVADVCNACHGVNRVYGNPPGACHDCHGEGD